MTARWLAFRRIGHRPARCSSGVSPTVLAITSRAEPHVAHGRRWSFLSGLTVDQFQRRTSVVEYTAASLKKSLKPSAIRTEGLDAHGRSAHSSGGQMKLADSARNFGRPAKDTLHWPSAVGARPR